MPVSLDKSPERIRTMFACVAPRYDLLNRLLSFGIDRSWRRRAVRMLLDRCRAEGPILDVCTGTGDLAFAFRRKCDRPILGIDFSPEMLRIAEAKRLRHGNFGSKIVFREGDALALPVENAAYALVTVAFGLRNTVDPDRALAEMARVCRPGGMVAVLEFSMPQWPVIAPLYRFYFRRLLPWIAGLFTKSVAADEAYVYLPESIEDFDAGEKLLGRLAAAGLENLDMRRMTFSTVTLYVGMRPAGADSSSTRPCT